MKTWSILSRALALIPLAAVIGGCAGDSTPPSPAVISGDPGGGSGPGSPPPGCKSVNPADVPGTSLVFRDKVALSQRDSLISTRVTAPTGANLTVTRNSSGLPTRVDYNPGGTAASYTDYFYYDSGGRITHFQHSTSSSATNFDEYYYYDSGGRLTHYQHSTSSSATNFDEYFSYNSAGLLVRWELSGQGKTGSQTFMYSC